MKSMLLKTIVPALLGAVMFTFTVSAETVSRLDLDTLIQEAFGKNPEIRAARARWGAEEARMDQVNALSDPEMGFDTWNIPSDFDLPETRNWIFFLRQRFPFPGTLSLRGEAARAMALQTREEYEATVREVIAKVKITYDNLYLVHKAIEVTEENVGILRRFEQIAQVKYATGAVSQQDVLKTQVELARLANDLITLEQELTTTRARLNTLLNRVPRSPLDQPEELEIIPILERSESLESLALEHRPELRATRAVIARSEREIELAKLKFYPNFHVALKRFQNRGIPQPNGWGVSASINIPWVFHRKHDQGVIETRHRLARAEALRDSLENDTRFLIEDLLVKIETAERRANLYQTSVLPLAEQAVKSADIGYRADRVDFLNLLESQRRLEEFKLEYYRAVTMQNQGVARLEQVIGIDLLDIENKQNGGSR